MEYAAQVDYVSLFRISMVPGMKLSELSIYRLLQEGEEDQKFDIRLWIPNGYKNRFPCFL